MNLLTMAGETRTAYGWAKHLGISPHTIMGRLRLGWSTVDALTQPVRPNASHEGRPRVKRAPVAPPAPSLGVGQLSQWGSISSVNFRRSEA